MTDEIIQKVFNFYTDNEFSRPMPGQKIVSVDKNIYEQKRLLLCNLRELYGTFKEQNRNIHIGFSKFASLRPNKGISGTSGTHSVCVYSIHENVKLLIFVIKLEETYHKLIEKAVC